MLQTAFAMERQSVRSLYRPQFFSPSHLTRTTRGHSHRGPRQASKAAINSTLQGVNFDFGPNLVSHSGIAGRLSEGEVVATFGLASMITTRVLVAVLPQVS
jgi:hypothetical protein